MEPRACPQNFKNADARSFGFEAPHYSPLTNGVRIGACELDVDFQEARAFLPRWPRGRGGPGFGFRPKALISFGRPGDVTDLECPRTLTFCPTGSRYPPPAVGPL